MFVRQFHWSPGIVANFLGENPDGMVECHFVVFYPIVVRDSLDGKSEKQVEQE
jgi:hypothetical protein